MKNLTNWLFMYALGCAAVVGIGLFLRFMVYLFCLGYGC